MPRTSEKVYVFPTVIEPEVLGQEIEDDQECGNCFFFKNIRCQRYPQPIPVSKSHWCGEWVIKK